MGCHIPSLLIIPRVEAAGISQCEQEGKIDNYTKRCALLCMKQQIYLEPSPLPQEGREDFAHL